MSGTCLIDCLNYLTPARGGWSIVRTSLLVPECHQLFVGAAACMRHIVLSSIELGLGARISCLNLNESDIISGSYEQLILTGADRLLNSLTPKPRVLMIYLTCIDDLLVTDVASFLEPLNRQHQQTRCIVCRMNPIMLESAMPPGISVQASMYGLLDPAIEHDRAVNFIGNNVALNPENELIRHLNQAGVMTRHISDYQRFSDFQMMAKSSLNIVMSPIAVYAAEEMKKRLNIDYCLMIPDYNFERIRQNYHAVFSFFKLPVPDFSAEEACACRALHETARHLKGRRLSIDHEATYRPFGMARLLQEHGFQVKTIYASEYPDYESADVNWARERKIEMIQPELFCKKTDERPKEETDTVCIGFEAAYQENSPYLVTLAADADLYGFQGIEQLCRMITESADHVYDLKKIIAESVLVV